MSYSVSLFEVPRGQYSKALKEALARYPEGHAERFLWAGKAWLMCAPAPLMVYPKCFQQLGDIQQGLAIRAMEGDLFVYGWDGNQVLICFLGSHSQLRMILQLLAAREKYQPQLWIDEIAKQELAESLAALKVKQSSPWPVLTEREQQALKMMSLKRLSSKPWLGLFAALSILVLFSYFMSMWSPWGTSIEPVEPGADFATRLVSTPGNVIPLLRLDYNQQLKLQQVSGWQLKSVDYNGQQMSYRLERDSGSIAELRHFSSTNDFHLQAFGRQAVLTRAIQLPSVIESPLTMHWHSVTELTDWLDMSLAIWLPATELRLGTIERVGLWQQQSITIELQDYYLPDLLTLAGILDGLPLLFQSGALRIQSDLIYGQITLQAIGALG